MFIDIFPTRLQQKILRLVVTNTVVSYYTIPSSASIIYVYPLSSWPFIYMNTGLANEE